MQSEDKGTVRAEDGRRKEEGTARGQAGRSERECALVWKRNGRERVLETQERAGVPYLYFPAFEESGLVRHGFSTRLGGVSRGDCATMNFALNRGDDPANVRENYRRMAAAIGFRAEQMVLAKQTHTIHIRRVTKDDAGKGYCRERDYKDIDGLMTDVPGLTLVTSYADCVPLLFLDPVRRVIAASHSGWRGTAAGMGRHTVEALRETYGCRAQDLLVGIGPSICQSCYEVGEEVAEAFAGLCGPDTELVRPIEEKPGKYLLNLQKINERILLEAGVKKEHIFVTDLCTCCNKDLLFSHRGSRGRRGNMAAFLCLRED
ncbi:MAG: peptidoglycan editing factor PgeF [Lachnospiraceae bacterium]|nr:peptidoglycan editing factor PgeF [Lachnospiraceae bacterium]